MIATRHLIITGRVQGVGYRAWAAHAARDMGLDGWVRNRADGSVEAVVSGDAAKVRAFLNACHNGPALARVDEIAISDRAEVPEAGFVTRPTG